MSTIRQFIFARRPAAKEFVALCLLNLFLFIQLVSFVEVVKQHVHKEKSTSTYYSQHQAIKTAPTEKQNSIEKLSVIVLLTAKILANEQFCVVRPEHNQNTFFLSDQCSSFLLKGRAPPLA